MGPELAFLIVVVAALLVWIYRGSLSRSRQRVRAGDEWRSYTIDRPTRRGSGRTPILLCFHGGGGRADRLRHQSGIREAALLRGFTVVFPEAPGGWIDARPERGAGRRDLVFVEALLTRLRRTEGEDGKMYALGVSNGGMFVHRLAIEEPRRFAGFATLLAPIPAAGIRMRPSGPPAPIVLVFGRDDQIMPWDGGLIAMGRRPGIVASAEATLDYWLRRNRCTAEPDIRRMEFERPSVEVRDYPASPGGAPVRFVSIDRWGHQWPRWDTDGGEFDIADLIFEFFDRVPAADARDAKAVRLQLNTRRGAASGKETLSG